MFNQISHIVAEMKFPMLEWSSGGGVSAQGCVCPGGVSAPVHAGIHAPVCPAGGEVSAPVHAGIHTPQPCGQNDRHL